MIACQLHDYVEIACMYHYAIKLTLASGVEVEGIALDTARNENLEECIKINMHNTNASDEHLVVLDAVLTMEALVDNPHFKLVTFK